MLEIGFESSLLTSVASSVGGAVAAGTVGAEFGSVCAETLATTRRPRTPIRATTRVH
jgi:hypothetical protein